MRAVRRGSPRGRRRLIRHLITTPLLAAATLGGPFNGRAEPQETPENEIRAALEKWRAAFNGGDQQRVCDLFAPDLVANYQGEPERDYSSLCQLLQTTLQDAQTVYHYSLKINEILVYGEVAIVRLRWTLEIDKADKPKEIIEEPAIDMFRRQADGSWKIARYLAYSSSQ